MAPRHADLVAYECKLKGLVQVMRHWRPYLWGCPFLVCTDHVSLKFLLDQRLSTIRVEYKSGFTNIIADALSHWDAEKQALVHAISLLSFRLLYDLCTELAADPTLVVLRQEVQAGHGDSWAVVDELVT